MIILHSKIPGLHLSKADAGERIAQAFGVEGGKRRHNGKATDFTGTQVEQYHRSQQTDAKDSPESAGQKKCQPQKGDILRQVWNYKACNYCNCRYGEHWRADQA